MPLSSVYAAPIELDLRPGGWERMVHMTGVIGALAALSIADLPMSVRSAAYALVLLLVVHEWRRASRRPSKLRLLDEGNVECEGGFSAYPEPASLQQARFFVGLPQLQFTDARGRSHACLQFPDRLDPETRHRLRLWLVTHREQGLAIGPLSESQGLSA